MNFIQRFFQKKFLSRFTFTEYAYLISWSLPIILIWKNMFVYDGHTYWAGWGHLWADWSVHITYVMNMTYRSLLLPYHPLWWGGPFRYHFAADMISSILFRSGVPLVQAFIVPSVICSFTLILAVYLFYRTIFKNSIIAMVSTPLFIFNGGLGFLWYIYYTIVKDPVLQRTSPLFTFSQIDSAKIEFANIVTNYFIPQRPFLLGFPISVFIIIYFWKILERKNKNPNIIHIICLGLLTGIFPVIHLYAYIMILMFAAYFLFWDYKKRRKIYFFWIIYFLLSMSIGAVIFVLLWGSNQILHQTIFSPLWPTAGNILKWFYYWAVNGGVLFIFAPISFLYAARKEKILTIPFACIFIASNLFIFQPHTWDNGKFITYSYLWSAGLIGSFLVRHYMAVSASHIKKSLITFIFCISIFSGAVDVINLKNFNQQKFQLFTDRQIELGKKIRKVVSKDEIILTGPTNSYISMLSGRQLFMGLDFWVSSYGIDTKDRLVEIQKIYSGSTEAKQLLKKYNIHYIAVTDRERGVLSINENFFNSNFTVVFRFDDATLYKI